MPTFGPPHATCHIFTFKEGLLSGVAHDLCLLCRAFSVDADPATGIKGSFDAASLVVETVMRDGHVHPDGLGSRDMDKIARTIRDEVLLSNRHPTIAFEAAWPSDAVIAEGKGQVTGQLTLQGVRRAVPVALSRVDDRWKARVTVHQPDFGIKPYTAMFGTLKVKPDVIIEISLPAAELAA